MATLHLDAVHKSYGSFPVIHGVSIDIQDGEFVTLVGPSGCGKSTLLRMIAGLETITTGKIQIDEKIVNDVAPRDRNIAMVFQSYALYPHKTVAQNMGYPLKLAGLSREEIASKVNSAADILSLTPLLDRKPSQLSGGQRQRVAMGRAIVRDPKVFLFDEPLSNLDAKLRVQMRTQIKELHQRLRTTTVYVTHDQIEAMTMADRIVVMRDGHVEQIGSPLELYDRPANIFVATFLGSPSMNLLKGRTEGSLFKSECGATIKLGPAHKLIASGRDVVMGIRPEHLFLHLSDDAPSLPVEVAVVEPTGAETLVAVRLGNSPLTAVIRERFTPQPGEAMQLYFDIANVHLFDDKTGVRLH